MKVGIVGFSAQKFNEDDAKEKIKTAFDMIEKVFDNDFEVVSGLTNLGIPKLAYEEAVERGWKTTGIACEKANEYELFPVDKTKIIGEEWGDESETFLKYIDILLRFGGGEQSLKEADQAKDMGIKVFEYGIEE